MTTYVPNYYSRFKCIASECKHTCCAGWEIDVDEISIERFAAYPDIMANINDGQMVLLEGDRCPFLREDGLCRMILDHGEDMLCDICRDHPRFRNYYEDRVEMGIGLCCEAACEIVLHEVEPFSLVPYRQLPGEILSMQDRSVAVSQRIRMLYDSSSEYRERAGLFYELERLDEEWSTLLANVTKVDITDAARDEFINDHEIAFEQLAVYFLFRHECKTWFARESCELIADICIANPGKTLEDVVRMFSGEVEYSDENMDVLEFNLCL